MATSSRGRGFADRAHHVGAGLPLPAPARPAFVPAVDPDWYAQVDYTLPAELDDAHKEIERLAGLLRMARIEQAATVTALQDVTTVLRETDARHERELDEAHDETRALRTELRELQERNTVLAVVATTTTRGAVA